MSVDPVRLQVEFSTEAAFRSEYASNIANGGVFVATGDAMDPRTAVIVVLDMTFCNQVIELAGEVVHCIPPEMADAGASPGVAIQFSEPVRELRKQFEPYAGPPVEGNERLTRSGRRAALRAPARLLVSMQLKSGGEIDCRTRDISSSGMMLSVTGTAVPVGERTKLTIHHPTTTETMDVDGTVVRHLSTEDGTITALGVEFHVYEARQTEVTAFIADVQSAEHSRRLGAINGPIAELGIEHLLQMFGSSSPRGTLCVSRGAEEGTVVFEGGNLCAARLGSLTSVEALKAMLSWRDGSFEFQARADEVDLEGEAVPLSRAIANALGETGQQTDDGLDSALEALSMDFEDELDLDHNMKQTEDGTPPPAGEADLDNVMRGSVRPEDGERPVEKTNEEPAKSAGPIPSPRPNSQLQIDLETTFTVDIGAADAIRDELTKTEEAILELALVGMSVERIIDVIPEPEPEVYSSLDDLMERDLISCA